MRYRLNMMDDAKQKLRKFYTATRKKLPAADAEKRSVRIAKNIFSLPGILSSDLILVYHKLGSEVDTSVLMELIIGSGRGVALPYFREDGSMGAGRIFSPRSDLAVGPLRAMEPADRLKGNVTADQLGAIVCPGIAFDEECRRLGRGGGYYDRFLRPVKGKAYIVGCAFDCQITPAPIPCAEHDVKMDAVITEKRAFPHGACPALRLPAEEDADMTADAYGRQYSYGNGNQETGGTAAW
jgi:5-formyltetrahydrofolate cyclo-ligase